MLSFCAEPFVLQFSSKSVEIKTYRIIIWPVLYGCETWSLTLREKHRLRVFENRVLRRVLELERDEVTVEWKKLHYEELNDLYSSRNIIRVLKSKRMTRAGHVACMGERRSIQDFGGETGGKEPT